jgi:hypothetical protein
MRRGRRPGGRNDTEKCRANGGRDVTDGTHDHDHESGDEGGDDDRPNGPNERSTAPQSAYTPRQAGLGALVALVGLGVTFGIPLLIVP